VSLASLSLDAGFTELRVLIIKRGFELHHLDNFQVADYCVVLFAV